MLLYFLAYFETETKKRCKEERENILEFSKAVVDKEDIENAKNLFPFPVIFTHLKSSKIFFSFFRFYS
jgi:hypothetical protein